MGVGEPPIGRRVAQWRVRRRMSQQVFADRLGKSKSWADKVERGVRALDRLSVIEEIAEVLRIDPVVLLGHDAPPPVATTGLVDGVEAVRAALARHDVFRTGVEPRPVPPADEVARLVGHAWLAYRHAHYPQLVRMLPDLLDSTRRFHTRRPDEGTALLVQAYRITSSVLVKLGDAGLAWLAADRAVGVAADDPVLAATAAVPLGQALRALGRGRLAMTTTIAAAHRIVPGGPREGPPGELTVCGTLLLQAALAAAGCGDTCGVAELVDHAADLADRVGDGPEHHQTSFGTTVVELARVVAAVELGDAGDALRRHATVTGRESWRRLPAEYRAAHLIDVARAYLQLGDQVGAGRLLVDADRTAPAEVRCRPTARTVIAEAYRGGPAAAGVAHLAVAIGLTR
ncbi:helix-turn-helix domain-containing protein [Micromonospora inyonensis]|uniref:Helix-turn-helix domain-containing protein n=1 Tax=Micromonospora inyonensis TaxID=47866 RepID=A0A1C6SAW0_9ACTN|nr:helix-turn-helix domain-containing protein [Micromonospora inyonensis]SCL26637.1 Helix-turn-helix domain-containing protein [Micromonospora inyonensis]